VSPAQLRDAASANHSVGLFSFSPPWQVDAAANIAQPTATPGNAA
jgi:hypothetical protein